MDLGGRFLPNQTLKFDLPIDCDIKFFSLMKKLLLIVSLCCMAAGVMLAQQRTVNGTITDSNGDPLIGASIMVKGTTTGTVNRH